MRVLVTGATGFVGSHLTEKLNAKGYSVNALIRCSKHKNLPDWLKNANIINGDITDPESVREALKGVDVVFHLASLLGRWQSEYDQNEYCRVNLTGTQILMDASHKEGIEHFIDLSTAGVMGRLITVPADENHPLQPDFPYEKSKYLAELALNSFMEKEKFPATIIRATHVYGARDKNTVKIFNLIKRTGIFPLIGGGNNLFQPIYVDDVVQALILSMEKPERSIGKTFLIAGKEIATYHDFIHLCAKVLDVPVMTLPLSERLAKLMALFIETTFISLNLEPPLTSSRVEFFSRDQTYKITKIQNELKFYPKTGLEDGLRQMLNC